MYLSDSLIDQITQSLMVKIQQGEFPPNTRLPSVRKHAQILGVSNETVLRAYDKLVVLGYLEAKRGSGFYVLTTDEISPKQNQSKKWLQQNPNVELWQKTLYEHDLTDQTDHIEIPEHKKNAVSFIQDALQHLQVNCLNALTQYANPQGYLPLREQLALKLKRQGISTHSENIICTNGAADALHLVIWAHFFPSQAIVVECPSIPLHVQRSLASGMEIYRVTRLEDGPDLDELKTICEKYKPKALLMSSLLHNPTSSCLSVYKAHQLLKMAEQYDFIIIDDDTYGDLVPPQDMLNITRLANLDQFNRVIQIGSFSKTLSAGLRSGYIAANNKVIQHILLYKSVGAIQSPILTDAIVAHILEHQDYEAHCQQLAAHYNTVATATRQKLIDLGWNIPETKAGMYLWGSVDDQDEFQPVLDATESLQLTYTPGSIFFSRSNQLQPFARFNLD